MSRMAQELERQLKELRSRPDQSARPARPARRIGGKMDETTPAPDEAVVPQQQQEDTMATAAAAKKTSAERSREYRERKKAEATKAAPAKTQKAPKAPKAPKAAKERPAPKNKALFLNTDGALSVTLMALQELKGLDETTQKEADKLIARLKSRGVK